MKRFKIIGAVILAAVVVVLLLLPDAGSMEKYEDMYQRGLYDQVSRSLQRELERKPQWHEARKLLVKAELKQNRLDSAVFHLLALEGEDIDISSLALLCFGYLIQVNLFCTMNITGIRNTTAPRKVYAEILILAGRLIKCWAGTVPIPFGFGR